MDTSFSTPRSKKGSNDISDDVVACMRFFKHAQDSMQPVAMVAPTESLALEQVVTCEADADYPSQLHLQLHHTGRAHLRCGDPGACRGLLRAVARAVIGIDSVLHQDDVPKELTTASPADPSRRSSLILWGKRTPTSVSSPMPISSPLSPSLLPVTPGASPPPSPPASAAAQLFRMVAQPPLTVTRRLSSFFYRSPRPATPPPPSELEGRMQAWLEPPGVLKEGFLKKTGSWNTSYKRRYFRLCGSRLVYYKCSGAWQPTKTPRGFIDIGSDSVSPNAVDTNTPWAFSLVRSTDLHYST